MWNVIEILLVIILAMGIGVLGRYIYIILGRPKIKLNRFAILIILTILVAISTITAVSWVLSNTPSQDETHAPQYKIERRIEW